MAEAIVNNQSRDFWDEVKKVKGTCVNSPVNIGDKTNSYDIAELFANKQDTLYNSVPSDPTRITAAQYETDKRLSNSSLLEMEVEYTDVTKAVKNIKKNKADDEGKLFSNHVLFASTSFYKCISCLFNGILVHGYTPKCLLNSTIISIPKNKRVDLSSDDNQRGVSLCSSLFKLFELVLLNKQNDKLKTSDMQYAYKSGHSTTVCTLVFKDVINHYLLQNYKTVSWLLSFHSRRYLWCREIVDF